MIYDVGDAAPVVIRVTDDDGALTNATVAIAVTRPDGTAGTASAPANLSTGVYRSRITIDQAGTWTYVWTVSGALTRVEPGELTAVSATTRVLVASMDEFKQHLNRAGSDIVDDAELRSYLVSATEWVERTIGGPVAVTTYTEFVPVSGWWITPTYRPLVSVTSLTPQLGAALDSSAYTVDTLRNGVRLLWGAMTGWYTLVYRAGLAAIPERAKLAGLIVATHLWQVQNGGGGLPYPGDDNASYVPGLGFAVPNRARQLLAPDTIPGIA